MTRDVYITRICDPFDSFRQTSSTSSPLELPKKVSPDFFELERCCRFSRRTSQKRISSLTLHATRIRARIAPPVVLGVDGTARGGVGVALTQQSPVSIPFIGVGEGVADLRPFDAADYARALMGGGSSE